MDKEEIKRLINESLLSEKEKLLWFNALQNCPREIASAVLDYFSEFPEKLIWLTDILKRKVEAAKNKDKDSWNKILAEEETELLKIIKK